MAFCYQAAVFLLEPFYVAAGFSLYLNRRTLLEAWDLELAFRKMSQRIKQLSSIVFLSFMISTPCFVSMPLTAKEPQQAQEIGQGFKLNPELRPLHEAKQQIKQVLEAPEFDIYDEYETWRFDFQRDKKEDTAPLDFDFGFSKFIGVFLEAIL
ncbi:MAG: hypothetical protein KZQ58_02400 [gamma proteobacterium symbiont of Bathyaustriella thionipta]|nr:hypothetical protein [gamma proteobacterium symbiont of Bathyaustriella thionipta]